MLDNLGIAFASVCLLVGGALLYYGVPKPDPSHTLGLFGGAALLSLGLLTMWRALRNKLEWRRTIKSTERVKITDEPNPQNRRRSQRVLLQVAVLVRAARPDGQSMQVQAFTSVVNAHGGLLESPLELTRNQKITLVNPQTGMDVGCRVVRVEKPSDASYTIAFEFDRRSPQFWPITFPPVDWEVTAAVGA